MEKLLPCVGDIFCGLSLKLIASLLLPEGGGLAFELSSVGVFAAGCDCFWSG